MPETTAPTPLSIEARAGTSLPPELADNADEARLALWEVERDLWSPVTFVARDASGSVQGAALTASRPYSAYRKIVDVVTDDDDVWEHLLAAVQTEDAPASSDVRPTPVAMHFEEHLALAPLTFSRRARIETLGFERAVQPVPSAPSTRPGDPTETAAWTWWRTTRPTRIAPYYGQTTDVTCGAVAALMGLEMRGHGAFDTASVEANRATEIGFWRQATNLPACEPIGLAVELAKSAEPLLGSVPRVILSAEGPVLLEDFEPENWEHALRVDLQLESLRQAHAAQIPIERRWIDISEVVELVRGGAQVLLLIDLTDLIDDPTPHWVLATDVVDEALIISDPWIQAANGETWADTYALPLPFTTIDRVTRWGEPTYRGVIILGTR